MDRPDDDGPQFIKAGDLAVLSEAAFQLHSFAVVNAYREGHPRLVSDDYLNAIAAETTTTAVELCLVGLWERVEGGYRINDDSAVAVVAETHRRMAEREAACLAAGGHLPSEDAPYICGRCGRPLTDP